MGYELQPAAAELVQQERPVGREYLERADAFERGGQVYLYPFDEKLSSTDILEPVLPYVEQLGVTKEEFYGIEDQDDELGGIAISVVKAVGEAGKDLELTESLRIQAYVVKAFVTARRMVDEWVKDVPAGDLELHETTKQNPTVWDELAGPVKISESQLIMEMLDGFDGHVTITLLGELERHFSNAAYQGLNTGCSRNNLMYFY